MPIKIPKLPELLDRKIYKTGQTRGADDDVIFQNRVGRNSTVLITYSSWKTSFKFPPIEKTFENGFIVLISPRDYFETKDINKELAAHNLKLGNNAVVFYETRDQWLKYNPTKLKWLPAQSRINPLKGKFVARVPATTALDGGAKTIQGFTSSSNKGAGIRVYEYASSDTIKKCRYQLEALFWLCGDSESVATKNGMTLQDATIRSSAILEACKERELLDYDQLINSRIINNLHRTVCPLCLEELSGAGFFNRMIQAEGREVPDLTVTEINLFHIEELRIGLYNHRPYNLGWGHHHCNVVTKDAGIHPTLQWMQDVIQRNVDAGLL